MVFIVLSVTGSEISERRHDSKTKCQAVRRMILLHNQRKQFMSGVFGGTGKTHLDSAPNQRFY